ncbi:MAG: hypothetical protein AAF741_13715 [Bacteroidota bacterium]
MYTHRKIAFQEIYKTGGWTIKIYTISKQGDFNQFDIYERAKKELPKWLSLKNGFDDDHYHIGFLIVHAGTEGVFSIINWWVGTNMLNTHIFITPYDQSGSFKKISGTGLAPCIWELEVINHERVTWTEKVPKKEKPDFKGYLESTFSKTV